MYWTPLWGASSQARGTGAAKRRHSKTFKNVPFPAAAATYTRDQNANDNREEETPPRGYNLLAMSSHLAFCLFSMLASDRSSDRPGETSAPYESSLLPSITQEHPASSQRLGFLPPLTVARNVQADPSLSWCPLNRGTRIPNASHQRDWQRAARIKGTQA